jgi:hypothetical protein
MSLSQKAVIEKRKFLKYALLCPDISLPKELPHFAALNV